VTRRLGTLELYASGLGLMLYSPGAVAGLREAEDYYTPAGGLREPLAARVEREQRIVMLGTGSPQLDYRVHVSAGAPKAALTKAATARARFALKINGGCLLVRDGYDPMEWEAEAAHIQHVAVPDRYYAVDALHVGAFGVKPPHRPDDPDGPMVIHLFINPTARRIASDGWPFLKYRAR
jgi:hypothetical protein